jgi:hypothetical protein
MKTGHLYIKIFRVITQQTLKLSIHRSEAKISGEIENPVVERIQKLHRSLPFTRYLRSNEERLCK